MLKGRPYGGSAILWKDNIEAKVTPRETFWDELVKESGVPSYHFEDYPQLQGLNLPELSHLSGEDAEFFTTELINIMQKDGVLTNLKTN